MEQAGPRLRVPCPRSLLLRGLFRLCSPVGRVDRHLLRPLSPSSHILPSLAPQLGPPGPVDTLVLPSPDPLVA